MNTVMHLIEPSRLLLSWQRPMVDDGRRTRRTIGELTRDGNSQFVFRYLKDSPDFEAAKSEGFQGYPAFRLNHPQHEQNVLEAFMVRLPSRKRGDFKEYLASHSLPTEFSGSDFALLAHTGARLPGDGFEIFPDISSVSCPFDLVVEVAGTRHHGVDRLPDVRLGDSVALTHEPENPVDPLAIAVMHPEAGLLGYMPKPYCEYLLPLIASHRIMASVCKLNGRPERRLVYILISVS